MAPGDLSTGKLWPAHGPGVYFAEPRSSWQQHSNKNTNCLLCKYLPEGDVDHQPYLPSIAERSMTAPRRRLGYITPRESFQRLLAG